MKGRFNERGSIPLVLMIVMVMTMSVVALTSLFMTERINSSLSATKDVQRLYEEDTVIELVQNTLWQQLRTKETNDIQNMDFLTKDDFVTLESVLQKETLPTFELEAYQVFVEPMYMPLTIDYFCTAVYKPADLTFGGFECLQEVFDMDLLVQVQKEQTLHTYALTIGGLVPKVSEDGQFVRIDTTNVSWKLSKK